MLIAIISVIVAAVVGVPVVTKMLDATKEPEPLPEPPSLKASVTSTGTSAIDPVSLNDRAGPAPSAPRSVTPVTVKPDAMEQDPFSDMDLQELAALTNSPALLQMMGLAPELPAAPTAEAQAAPPPSAPASPAPSTQPASTLGSSQKRSAKSLVSVNWEGEWSAPPMAVQPPQDEVEKQRGTPSADALFNDSDVPVITKTPANHRRKKAPPPPTSKEPGRESKANRPQKLREVAPTQNNLPSVTPPKPPLKLFVEDAPEPLTVQSPYEVIQPTRPQPQAPRANVFQRASGASAHGSARENHLDFQPFFALDALRVINEARTWTKSQKNRLSEVSREELGVIINEELPEWSLLLSHVNGFLFDLAQEQLRLRQLNGWDATEANASLEHGKPGGVSFRQSQWQNVATEEFIAKASTPSSKRRPADPKRFIREG